MIDSRHTFPYRYVDTPLGRRVGLSAPALPALIVVFARLPVVPAVRVAFAVLTIAALAFGRPGGAVQLSL